ncbi:hypothetical protein RDWZM_007612 [Blomia tropicalis]|uniref:Uncharacterized protein n=1 Tax=Blomia tropicalis TaxID=40697 RepID=A0A9Q0M2T0_BLOTA|nr:hypothetical protein RDWZM_007612 [Blomia tropicalis]
MDLIDERDFEWKTPLHVCCISNSIDCAEILLMFGAQVNSLKRGDWTPLMISLAKGSLPMARLLIQYGADPSIINKDGWNAIHIATRTGNIELIELLEKQPNIKPEQWLAQSKNKRTLLHIASSNGHLALVKHFLVKSPFAKYFTINCKDSCGTTPFMDAARTNCVDICQFYWDHSNKSLDIYEYDNLGRTALHLAAQTNSCDAIVWLIQTLNYNIECKDQWKQTPLFLSVREGHEEATKLLLKFGAKQSTDSKNRCPIDIANIYGHKVLVDYMCCDNRSCTTDNS